MTQITKADIQALLIVAGKDEDRAPLACINFERIGDKVLLVATDGRRLLALQRSFDADMPCPQGRLSRAFAEAMAKTATKGDRMCFCTDGTIRLGYVTTTLRTEIDYPNWRKVCNVKPSDKPGQFQSRYMADFSKVAKLLGNYDPHCIGIRHNDLACAFVLLGVENAFAVCMPFREEISASYTPPAWIASDAVTSDKLTP